MATVHKMLHLYAERYFNFNVRNLHEKLREEHGIQLSYTWVKTGLQSRRPSKDRKKRGSYRKRRWEATTPLLRKDPRIDYQT